MAQSIALSYAMDKIITTSGTQITELSLSGNGVKIEIVNEALVVSSATSIPSGSGSPDVYFVTNTQFTVTYNADTELVGVVGIEDVIAQKNVVGGVYDLSNNTSFNIRRDGTKLLVTEY